MNNVDAMQTPASAFSAISAATAAGVSAWATAPMMAGAGMNLPNVGRAGEGMSFPALLSRPSNSNVQNTTNNNSQSMAPVFHIAPVFHSNGKLTKEEIMQHSTTIAKAVQKEARNFNSATRKV